MQDQSNKNPQELSDQDLKQRIKHIIDIKYDKTKQKLNLNGYSVLWNMVLDQGNWEKLTTLSLWYCGIIDTNVQNLSKKEWPALRQLYLNKNKITTQGIVQLKPHYFPKLEVISLVSNKIGNDGLSYVLANYESLRVLLLWENKITGQGMLALVQTKIQQLQELCLENNNIGSQGAKLLGKSHLPNLTNLNISGCNICNEGCKHLIKSMHNKLVELSICRNAISFGGRQAIPQNSWSQLRRIYMGQANKDSITFLELMTVNWSQLHNNEIIQPLIYGANRSTAIQKDIGRLLASKFFQPLDSV